MNYQQPLPSLPEAVKIEKPIHTALVLGGGGARGSAHLGVLEVLEGANISIDLIVGSSIGSFVGALYADNPDAAYLKQKLLQVKRRDLTYYNPLVMRLGIWNARAMTQFLEQQLRAKSYHELKIPLKVVATNLLDGDEVVFSGGELVPSICASCAVPFYFQPVSLYGRLLVDGCIVDPVPIKIAKESNPKLIIAVDLSGIVNHTPPKNMLEAVKQSVKIANMRHCANSALDADVIIKPTIDSSIDFFDDKHSMELYQAGKEAAMLALPTIQKKIEEINLQK